MKARYELMSRVEEDMDQTTNSENGDTIEGSVPQREELCKTFNYANMRATDIPTVQRLYPPAPATIKQEKILDNIKEKLLDTVQEYKSKHCDSKGKFKNHNLSRDEMIGVKEIKKDIKEKKMVVFTTDKSGRFSADTPDNYEKAIKQHTTKDLEIDNTRVKQIENKVNQHMRQFNKMFKVGSIYSQKDRVTKATLSTYTPAPPL